MAFVSVPAESLGIDDERDFLQYCAESPGHETLQVISDPKGILGRNIGNGLWTAATELIDFLRGKPHLLLNGQTVLELGSGLGVVGQVFDESRVAHAFLMSANV